MKLSDRELCETLEERTMFDVSDFRRYLKAAYYASGWSIRSN